MKLTILVALMVVAASTAQTLDTPGVFSSVETCDAGLGAPCNYQFEWDLVVATIPSASTNWTQMNTTVTFSNAKTTLLSYITLVSAIPDPVLVKTPLDQEVDETICDISYALACENAKNLPQFRESGIYCYSSALNYYRYSLTSITTTFSVDALVTFTTANGTKTVSLTCATDTGSCAKQGGTSSDIPMLDSVYHVVESYIWQSGSLEALNQALIVSGGSTITNTTDPSVLDNWFFIDTNSPEVDLSASTAGKTLYLANCMAPTGLGGDEAADPFPEAARSTWADLFGATPSSFSIVSSFSSTSFIIKAEMDTPTPPSGLLNIAELYIYIPYQNNTSIQW